METNDKLLAIEEHLNKLKELNSKELNVQQQALLDAEVHNIYISTTPRVVTNINDINPE